MEEEKEKVINLLLEDDLLSSAKEVYGMGIEPRGKEIYFLKKELRKNPLFRQWERDYDEIYGGDFARTAKWDKVWREFKAMHNLKKVIAREQ